jgi:hypothetical protein
MDATKQSRGQEGPKDNHGYEDIQYYESTEVMPILINWPTSLKLSN